MWKLSGAFLLFLICVMLGRTASEKLRKKADMLSALLADMKTMRSHLKNGNMSIGNIAAELSENGRLKDFWAEMKKEVDMNRSFAEAYRNTGKLINGLNKKDLESFETFAEAFGKDDVRSELNRLDALIEKFEEEERMYKCECPQKVKLLRSLSVLGGIALALMFL